MKKYYDVTLIIGEETPITLEVRTINDNIDYGILLSIGKWQNDMGGDDGESVLMTLEEYDDLIIELQKYRSLVDNLSKENG